MANELLLDVENLIKDIDINSFDWVFYLTYNPELVFIGINDESSAEEYFSQQSGQEIANENIFFELFERSLVDPSAPRTKFDPVFYKSYYSINHLFSSTDIASFWLLSGYNNNENVLSEKSLVFYEQMDIDKIIHNTETNTPEYLVDTILQSSNNSTEDFLNSLILNSPEQTPFDKQQNLVIYLNQQIVNNFSSIKSEIDSYIKDSLESSFDNYKELCDSYFQSKSSEFLELFNSSSTQHEELNLDKLNLFEEENFESISDLHNNFHDLQEEFSEFKDSNLSIESTSNPLEYKDFSLYIKELESLKNLDSENNSIKNLYKS